jgi:hypothetical protein
MAVLQPKNKNYVPTRGSWQVSIASRLEIRRIIVQLEGLKSNFFGPWAGIEGAATWNTQKRRPQSSKTTEYDFAGMCSDVDFPGYTVAHFEVASGEPTTG